MRASRVSILTALAASALVCLVASAPAHAVTLCKANENPCAAGNQYSVPTTFEAKLPKATSISFTGTPSATCASSTGKAETTTSGTPLLGEIVSLSFGSCTNTCTTVEARNLPWSVAIEATGGGNGTVELAGGGSGNPGVRLTNCLSGATCAYGVASATGSVTGGSPATIAFAFELNREEGGKLLCSATTTVTGSYVFFVPGEPIFVSALP